jgi:hypothetical protein
MSTKIAVKLRRKPRQASSQSGVFFECCQRWYPAAQFHKHTPEVKGKNHGRSV